MVKIMAFEIHVLAGPQLAPQQTWLLLLQALLLFNVRICILHEKPKQNKVVFFIDPLNEVNNLIM